jgi:hypothetical protein
VLRVREDRLVRELQPFYCVQVLVEHRPRRRICVRQQSAHLVDVLPHVQLAVLLFPLFPLLSFLDFQFERRRLVLPFVPRPLFISLLLSCYLLLFASLVRRLNSRLLSWLLDDRCRLLGSLVVSVGLCWLFVHLVLRFDHSRHEPFVHVDLLFTFEHLSIQIK